MYVKHNKNVNVHHSEIYKLQKYSRNKNLIEIKKLIMTFYSNIILKV